MKTLHATAAGLILCLPLASFSQEIPGSYGPREGQFEFTLGGSGGNDNEFNAGSFGLSTSLGYFMTDTWEVGARHSMDFFDSDDVDANFSAVTRAFVDYNLDLDRLRPFVGLNLGIRYGNGEVDETGTLAPEWGVKFFALKNTFLMGSMEYQWFFEDIDDADDRADEGQFVYSVGIGFTF